MRCVHCKSVEGDKEMCDSCYEAWVEGWYKK